MKQKRKNRFPALLAALLLLASVVMLFGGCGLIPESNDENIGQNQNANETMPPELPDPVCSHIDQNADEICDLCGQKVIPERTKSEWELAYEQIPEGAYTYQFGLEYRMPFSTEDQIGVKVDRLTFDIQDVTVTLYVGLKGYKRYRSAGRDLRIFIPSDGYSTACSEWDDSFRKIMLREEEGEFDPAEYDYTELQDPREEFDRLYTVRFSHSEQIRIPEEAFRPDDGAGIVPIAVAYFAEDDDFYGHNSVFCVHVDSGCGAFPIPYERHGDQITLQISQIFDLMNTNDDL